VMETWFSIDNHLGTKGISFISMRSGIYILSRNTGTNGKNAQKFYYYLN
jgi:hypothetical protein